MTAFYVSVKNNGLMRPVVAETTVATTTTKGINHPALCRTKSEGELREAWNNYVTKNVTSGLSAASIMWNNLKDFGDTPCKIKVEHGSPLNERSLCPWHYVINTDHNRYPVTLQEAVCNCGDGACADGPGHCEHVTYKVRVFQNKGCDSKGNYKFTFSWYPLSVGCACALNATTTTR